MANEEKLDISVGEYKLDQVGLDKITRAYDKTIEVDRMAESYSVARAYPNGYIDATNGTTTDFLFIIEQPSWQYADLNSMVLEVKMRPIVNSATPTALQQVSFEGCHSWIDRVKITLGSETVDELEENAGMVINHKLRKMSKSWLKSYGKLAGVYIDDDAASIAIGDDANVDRYIRYTYNVSTGDTKDNLAFLRSTANGADHYGNTANVVAGNPIQQLTNATAPITQSRYLLDENPSRTSMVKYITEATATGANTFIYFRIPMWLLSDFFKACRFANWKRLQIEIRRVTNTLRYMKAVSDEGNADTTYLQINGMRIVYNLFKFSPLVQSHLQALESAKGMVPFVRYRLFNDGIDALDTIHDWTKSYSATAPISLTHYWCHGPGLINRHRSQYLYCDPLMTKKVVMIDNKTVREGTTDDFKVSTYDYAQAYADFLDANYGLDLGDHDIPVDYDQFRKFGFCAATRLDNAVQIQGGDLFSMWPQEVTISVRYTITPGINTRNIFSVLESERIVELDKNIAIKHLDRS